MYDSILDRCTAAAEIKFPARESVSSKVRSTQRVTIRHSVRKISNTNHTSRVLSILYGTGDSQRTKEEECCTTLRRVVVTVTTSIPVSIHD